MINILLAHLSGFACLYGKASFSTMIYLSSVTSYSPSWIYALIAGKGVSVDVALIGFQEPANPFIS